MSQEPIIPTEFISQSEGTVYILPEYRVMEGKGLVKTGTSQIIAFVRGSKLGSDNVEPNDGILHEALLAVMIHDLKIKNELVPSYETGETIGHLEQALTIQQSRQQRRQQEGTQGTYQK